MALLQLAHPLPLRMLQGSQTVIHWDLGPGVRGSKMCHRPAPHPCKNGSGGSANTALEVSFPPLLLYLATLLTF